MGIDIILPACLPAAYTYLPTYILVIEEEEEEEEFEANVK